MPDSTAAEQLLAAVRRMDDTCAKMLARLEDEIDISMADVDFAAAEEAAGVDAAVSIVRRAFGIEMVRAWPDLDAETRRAIAGDALGRLGRDGLIDLASHLGVIMAPAGVPSDPDEA